MSAVSEPKTVTRGWRGAAFSDFFGPKDSEKEYRVWLERQLSRWPYLQQVGADKGHAGMLVRMIARHLAPELARVFRGVVMAEQARSYRLGYDAGYEHGRQDERDGVQW